MLRSATRRLLALGLFLATLGCSPPEAPPAVDLRFGDWSGGFGQIEGDRPHWSHITANLERTSRGLNGEGTYLVGPDAAQLSDRTVTITGSFREGEGLHLTLSFGRRKLRCEATYGPEHIQGTCNGQDLTLRLLRSEPPQPADLAAIQGVYPLGDDRRALISHLGPIPMLLDLPSGNYRALFFKGEGTWVAGPRLLVGHPEAYRLTLTGDSLTVLSEGRSVRGKRRDHPREESFSFTSTHDGVELRGTLLLPPSAGPHPSIVWVHGSGRTPRSEAMFFPQYFADLGFAVLAFDKRGVGESAGSYALPNGATFSEPFLRRRGADVASAADALRGHPQIDASKVGLVGISQAGWVMPVAASATECAFTISLGGGATPLSQEDHFSELTQELESDASLLSIEDAIAKVRARPTRDHDWSGDFASQRCPGLWLYGLNDRSNPSQLAVELLEKVKASTGNDMTILEYPQGNHPLMQSRIGGNAERLVVSRFVPGMFTAIEAWLEERQLLP